jgi:diphosphomevalonate decarboxylase
MSRQPEKVTAVAHPNIALIKYWGKRDMERNIPAVGSLSITLDGLTTTTSTAFEPTLRQEEFLFAGKDVPEMRQRVADCLNLVRDRTGTRSFALVESENDFPTAAGLASSASGFAALVVAADRALGSGLPLGELADIARHGSGSAPRSLFGGFVELRLTPDGVHPTECRQVLEPSAWPLRVVVAVTDTGKKEVGSTQGMMLCERSSPFFGAWVESSQGDLAEALMAVQQRDFEVLGEVSESSCLKMHAVMLSARPGLVYWNEATVKCIHRVREMRGRGVPVFFTVDAGPQVKAVCLADAADRVAAALREIPGVIKILESGLGEGARVVAHG